MTYWDITPDDLRAARAASYENGKTDGIREGWQQVVELLRHDKEFWAWLHKRHSAQYPDHPRAISLAAYPDHFAEYVLEHAPKEGS